MRCRIAILTFAKIVSFNHSSSDVIAPCIYVVLPYTEIFTILVILLEVLTFHRGSFDVAQELFEELQQEVVVVNGTPIFQSRADLDRVG